MKEKVIVNVFIRQWESAGAKTICCKMEYENVCFYVVLQLRMQRHGQIYNIKAFNNILLDD